MSWMHALRQRLSEVVRGQRLDRDLHEEIAYHLELETARQEREGLDPEAARTQALKRFGNAAQFSDATRDERGARLLEGAGQDLSWAFRALRKSPGFTALALLTLVLGIASTTVAFTVFDTVLLRPLPFRDAERLVFIQEVNDTHSLRAPSHPNFESWRESAREFDGLASAMMPYGVSVWPSVSGGEAVHVTRLGVSRHFFATLGVTPFIGREFTDDENREGGPRAVMVSYEFWQTQLGARMPLGNVLLNDAATPVVGVLPPGFRFMTAADIYAPHEQYPGTTRSAHNYLVIARLKPGATLLSARADMTRLSRALRATFGTQTGALDADVQPLREYLVANYRTLILAVFGAATLVLLIACTNLVSAQLARARVREREIVVRAALGASRGRLTRQLVFESALLVLAGSVMASALAWLTLNVIKSVGGSLVPRLHEIAVDGRVIVFSAGVAILATLFVGVYPALRLAGGDAGLVLRNGRSGSTTVHASVWRLLVGFEVAMTVMLLVGSTLLVRTLHNILTDDPGFAAQSMLQATLSVDTDDLARIDDVRAQLGAIPGVNGVAFANRAPLSWGNGSGPVRRRGDPDDRDFPAMAGFRLITPEYFDVLRQPMLRGRAFTSADKDSAAPVAIISSGIAERLWPGQDPIGKPILTHYLWGQWLTVVGVVTEASHWSSPKGTQNEIFVPLAQHPTRTEGQLVIMIRSQGDPHALIPMVRARLHEVVPHLPAQIGTISDRIATSAADRRFAMLALTAFGVVALLLSAVGIYGVMWYIVSTRAHEIGIRMALGATAALVQRQVLFDAAIMTCGGIFVGLCAGVAGTRLLQGTLYGVSRLDPITYLIGAAVAMAAALAAAYLPARASSQVNPLTAIRGV